MKCRNKVKHWDILISQSFPRCKTLVDISPHSFIEIGFNVIGVLLSIRNEQKV